MNMQKLQKHYTSSFMIWDIPIRLFHWTLVVFVCISYFSGKYDLMTVHTTSGLVILILITFRVLWGVVGSTNARFYHFIHRPRAILMYLINISKKKLIDPTIGHNPAGSLVILVMLITLAIQALSGLFANDDVFTKGPLTNLVSKSASDSITSLHKNTFNVLIVVIFLHSTANLLYLVKGENLIWPMITGYKPWPKELQTPQLYFANLRLAMVLLISSTILICSLLC